MLQACMQKANHQELTLSRPLEKKNSKYFFEINKRIIIIRNRLRRTNFIFL